MFIDDEDYGFLTGGLGDLNGDGRVDLEEYLNEEDDFQRIMCDNKDDDSDFDDSFDGDSDFDDSFDNDGFDDF